MFNTISSTEGTCRIKKIERLVLLRFIERENTLEWGSPYFTQSRPKTNRVSFLSEFRNLNKQLKHQPYTMPKINEMLLKLEGFK